MTDPGPPASRAAGGAVRPPALGPTAELLAVIAAGAVHVVAELTVSPFAARVVNAVLVVAFSVYVVWRARSEPGLLRRWGLTRHGLAPALRAQALFVAPAALSLFALGAVLETLPLPPTFFLTLALYPLWGLAQQFALQNLIAGNLPARLGALGVATVAATLFAVSHFPRLELVALTFAAGLPFTLIYRRHPNLWAAGIAHGILGALAFHLALGEDPGTMILEGLRSLLG